MNWLLKLVLPLVKGWVVSQMMTRWGNPGDAVLQALSVALAAAGDAASRLKAWDTIILGPVLKELAAANGPFWALAKGWVTQQVSTRWFNPGDAELSQLQLGLAEAPDAGTRLAVWDGVILTPALKMIGAG